MIQLIRKRYNKGEVLAPRGEDSRVITYVMTTGTPDRDNETVDPMGGDFSEYAINPAVQWNHDTDDFGVGSMALELAGPIPEGMQSVHPQVAIWNDYIGEGTNWPKVGGPRRPALLGNVFFSEVGPKAQEAFGKVKEGTLRGASISFNPMSPVRRGNGGGNHYDKWKLLEFTVCPVGSNPDAVKVSKSLRKAGEEVYSTLDRKMTTISGVMPDGYLTVSSSNDWHHPSQVMGLEEFSAKAKQVANSLKGETSPEKAGPLFGERKVFLHYVAAKMGIPRPAFDQMAVAANRKGLIQLSRADYVEVMNKQDVANSETKHANATFNFLNKNVGKGEARDSNVMDFQPGERVVARKLLLDRDGNVFAKAGESLKVVKADVGAMWKVENKDGKAISVGSTQIRRTGGAPTGRSPRIIQSKQGKTMSKNYRKCWIVGKTAVLLKSDGEVSSPTQEYLEQRGLEDVHLEDKEPDEFEEQDMAPASKGALEEWAKEEEAEPEHEKDSYQPSPEAVTAMAMKAEDIMAEDESKGLDDAMGEAMDPEIPFKKLKSVKALVLRRIKRFVVKMGRKGYLKTPETEAHEDHDPRTGDLTPATQDTDDVHGESRQGNPADEATDDVMMSFTKDVCEADHMDEKTAKAKAEDLNEKSRRKNNPWPEATVSTDLIGWENTKEPPSGPDSMGNTTNVADRWPSAASETTSETFQVKQFAKALEDDGWDPESALKTAKRVRKEWSEDEGWDPEAALKRAKALLKKGINKGDAIDSKGRPLNKMDRVKPDDSPKIAYVKDASNPDKVVVVFEDRTERVYQDGDLTKKSISEKHFIVKTRKGLYVYKSGTVASADDAEVFTRSKAEEVAEDWGGNTEEKSFPFRRFFVKEEGGKFFVMDSDKNQKVAVFGILEDAQQHMGVLQKSVNKGDPLEGMAEDEQGVPVGLRSLRKLCKDFETDLKDRDPGPMREAMEMALKLLHKARGKVYKDFETDDEVEKRLKALEKTQYGVSSGVLDGTITVNGKPMTRDQIKALGNAAFRDILTSAANGKRSGIAYSETGSKYSWTFTPEKSKDMDDDMEMKTDDPPHIESKSDGFCVMQGVTKAAGPFQDRDDAVAEFKRLAYRRVKRGDKMSSVAKNLLTKIKGIMLKAADTDETPDDLKGKFYVASKDIDEAMKEEKDADMDMDDMSVEESKRLKAAMDDMEDARKSLDRTVYRAMGVRLNN